MPDIMLSFLPPYPLPLHRLRGRGSFLKKDIPQGQSPCDMSFFKINPAFTFWEGGIKGGLYGVAGCDPPLLLRQTQ